MKKTLISVLVLGFLTSACSKHFIKPLTGTHEVPQIESSMQEEQGFFTTVGAWMTNHPYYTAETAVCMLVACCVGYWCYNRYQPKKVMIDDIEDDPSGESEVPPQTQQEVQQFHSDDASLNEEEEDSGFSSSNPSESGMSAEEFEALLFDPGVEVQEYEDFVSDDSDVPSDHHPDEEYDVSEADQPDHVNAPGVKVDVNVIQDVREWSQTDRSSVL